MGIMTWQRDQGAATAQAYVPLSFAPGEVYQFDWSHEIVLLNGATVTAKVARVRLCHSRMMFVRAHPRATQEMVFDAHDKAFAFFKGACTRGIDDNMKTAIAHRPPTAEALSFTGRLTNRRVSSKLFGWVIGSAEMYRRCSVFKINS
jgi:hypothetical protein